MNYYKISEKQLLNFIKSRLLTDALYAGGITEWDWYDDALEEHMNRYKQKENIPPPEEGYDDDFWYNEAAENELNKYTIIEGE